MPKFDCEITEIGRTTYSKTIEADTLEEAQDKMMELYEDGELQS